MNRAPGSSSRRIDEVKRHAAEIVHAKVNLHVVGAIPPESRASGDHELPGIETLARELRHVVDSEARRAVVVEKLRLMAIDLVDQADGRAEREEVTLSATAEDREDVARMLAELAEAERGSLAAAGRCMDRIERLLPRTLDKLTSDVSNQMGELIAAEERWLGKDQCVAYVQSHALPHAVRAAARAMEEAIAVELQRLDDDAGSKRALIDKLPELVSMALDAAKVPDITSPLRGKGVE